jgi:hypothetical protein
LSTHAIGAVRLLLGSLLLLAIGALLFWWLFVRLGGESVLIIRDGSLEIEPWAGDVRSTGTDLEWNHVASDVEVGVYRSADDESDFELEEPTKHAGVHGMRIGLRIAGTLLVPEAIVLSTVDGRSHFAVKASGFVRRGDVWVHQGFPRNGHKQRMEIATIELLDATGTVFARYQNPDRGRRVKFRIKLKASSGK